MKEKEKKISKFCNENGFSIKKFITLFIEKGILIKSDEISEKSGNQKFYFNNKFNKLGRKIEIDNENSFIVVNEEEVLKYLTKNNFKENLFLSEEEKFFLQLTDIKLKKERFLEFLDKKLIFLDFEAKNQEYSQSGIIIYDNGKIVKKQYLICNESVSKDKSNELKNSVKDLGVDTIISNKKELDKILKSIIKEGSIIVSHNSNAERKILQKLDIDVSKIEFICTEKFSEGFVEFYTFDDILKSPNLIELANFFKIKLNLKLVHTAFYDSFVVYEIFLNYEKMLKNIDIKNFPLKHVIKQRGLKILTRKEKLEKRKERKEIKNNYLNFN